MNEIIHDSISNGDLSVNDKVEQNNGDLLGVGVGVGVGDGYCSNVMYLKKIDIINRYLKMCGSYGITDNMTEISVAKLKKIDNVIDNVFTLHEEITILYNKFDVDLKNAKRTCESVMTILKNLLDSCHVVYKMIHKNDGNYLKLISRNEIISNYDTIYSKYKSYYECAYDKLVIDCEQYDHDHDHEHIEKGQFTEMESIKGGIKYIKGYGISLLNKEEYDILGIEITNPLDIKLKMELSIGGVSIFTKSLEEHETMDILSGTIKFIPDLKYMVVCLSLSSETLLGLSKESINNIKYKVTYAKRNNKTESMMILPLKTPFPPYFNQFKYCNGMGSYVFCE